MDPGFGGLSLARQAAWLDGKFIEHEMFMRTLLDVRQALMGNPMVLLTGVSGTGKSALASKIVGELNRGCPPGRVRAVMVLAPATHRRAFSWKDMWTEISREVGDPLPERKLDRTEAASRLAQGLGVQKLRGTEGSLQRAVRDVFQDLGVKLLVIDDAGSLLKNEAGRSFRDQLDVLRNLTAAVGCTVLLVATPSILRSLTLSPELERRMEEIVLQRYRFGKNSTADDRKAFRRVLRTIRDKVREQTVWNPKFNDELNRHFYDGCLGCVGILIEWVGRALVRAGGSELRWEHFRDTALSDAKRKRFTREFRRHEELCEEALQRLLGDTFESPEEAAAQAVAVGPNDAVPPQEPASRHRTARPGVPTATRHQNVKTLTG